MVAIPDLDALIANRKVAGGHLVNVTVTPSGPWNLRLLTRVLRRICARRFPDLTTCPEKSGISVALWMIVEASWEMGFSLPPDLTTTVDLAYLGAWCVAIEFQRAIHTSNGMPVSTSSSWDGRSDEQDPGTPCTVFGDLDAAETTVSEKGGSSTTIPWCTRCRHDGAHHEPGTFCNVPTWARENCDRESS